MFSLNLSPEIQVKNASFGFNSNLFGFDVAGFSNQRVIVEASTNLSTSEWVPLQTNNLSTNALYFSDPQWTNYPARFYRLRSP